MHDAKSNGDPRGRALYAAGQAPAPGPRLSGEVEADLCVIGGGLTGVSAALHAAEAGARVVLVEAGRIGDGASGRNGGQINSGFQRDQPDVEALLGRDHARALWDLAEEAKALVRTRIATHAIDCGLRPGVLYAAVRDSHARALAAYAEHLTRDYAMTGIEVFDAAAIADEIASPVYRGGIFDPSGGHLDPLALVRGLARAAEAAGARLFEESPAGIADFDAGLVPCPGGRVRARQIIVACEAWTGDVVPALAGYTVPIESYQIATAPLGRRGEALIRRAAAVVDSKFALDYYRVNPEGRLIFAGGESYFAPPADLKAFVRPRMLKVFGQLADAPIEFGWRGTVAVTANRLPHLGRAGRRGLFAHGFSGQGLVLSVLAGRILSDVTHGRTHAFETFARIPHFRFPGGRALRRPIAAAGLAWYALRDRL